MQTASHLLRGAPRSPAWREDGGAVLQGGRVCGVGPPRGSAAALPGEPPPRPSMKSKLLQLSWKPKELGFWQTFWPVSCRPPVQGCVWTRVKSVGSGLCPPTPRGFLSASRAATSAAVTSAVTWSGLFSLVFTERSDSLKRPPALACPADGNEYFSSSESV